MLSWSSHIRAPRFSRLTCMCLGVESCLCAPGTGKLSLVQSHVIWRCGIQGGQPCEHDYQVGIACLFSSVYVQVGNELRKTARMGSVDTWGKET